MKRFLPVLSLVIALGCSHEDSPAPKPAEKTTPAKEEPKPAPAPTNAERRKATKDKIADLGNVLKAYETDFGKYPDSLKSIPAKGPKNVPYWEGDYKDAWGNELIYVENASNPKRPGAHNT